jgi:branched-subunit amino acid ABC-type transport system permease component
MSGALAGIVGLLLAFDVNLRPSLGLHAMFAGVITAVLGGALCPGRQVLAALLLATGQHLGGIIFGTAWQDAMLFIIFFAAILLRGRVSI